MRRIKRIFNLPGKRKYLQDFIRIQRWTTGKVYVSGTNAGPYTSTFATLTGSKSLNASGAGNITLVAGGIANGLHSGFTYVSFDRIQMKLTFPANPLPSMSPAGIAAGAGLVVLAVGYALRRRF